MMVHIVFRIEGGQREPGECGRKLAALDRFPKHSRPLDVIVTIKVAAADGGSGKLELCKNEANRDGGRYKLEDSKSGVRLKPGGCAGRGRHQSLNWVLFGSLQLVDQFE